MSQHTLSRKVGSGFTLVELLVVIGIISVLAAILMPSLEQSLASARSVYCMNNLKQIGASTHLYTNDNRGWVIPFSMNYTLNDTGVDRNIQFFTLLAYLNYLPQGNMVFYKGKLTYNGIDYSFMAGTFGTANPRTPSNPLHYCPESCVLNDRASYLASYVNRFVYGSRGPDTYYNLDSSPVLMRSGNIPTGLIVKAVGPATTTGLPPSKFIMWGDTCSWNANCVDYPYPTRGITSRNATLCLARAFTPFSNPDSSLHLRHNRGGNAWFADGHVANVLLNEIIDEKLGVGATYGTYNP